IDDLGLTVLAGYDMAGRRSRARATAVLRTSQLIHACLTADLDRRIFFDAAGSTQERGSHRESPISSNGRRHSLQVPDLPHFGRPPWNPTVRCAFVDSGSWETPPPPRRKTSLRRPSRAFRLTSSAATAGSSRPA